MFFIKFHKSSQQKNDIQQPEIEISLPQTAIYISQECQICFTNKPDQIFDCGHSLCKECLDGIRNICPFCRKRIGNTKKLIS